jgi:hypothetical protein
MGQFSSSSRGKAKAEEPAFVVEPQVDMSSTRVMQFVWHHQQHCMLNVEPKISLSSSEMFTLFPLLPAELRIKIWEAVAEERHAIE